MRAGDERARCAAADCDKCDKDMCKICFMCLIIAFYGPWGRTHTQCPYTHSALPLPLPACHKVQNKFQTVEMLEMSSSFKCVLNICTIPRRIPKMFLIIFKYFFYASRCRF